MLDRGAGETEEPRRSMGTLCGCTDLVDAWKVLLILLEACICGAWKGQRDASYHPPSDASCGPVVLPP